MEIPEELADEKGIGSGDMVKVSSARGEIQGKALVTKRIRPLMIGDKRVYQIGFPIHWGFLGRGKQARIAGQPCDSNSGGSQFICPRIQGFSGETGEALREQSP